MGLNVLLRTTTSYAALAALSLVTGWGASAYAADKNAGLEEIVVTATKREERLQDVPISLTAISAEALKTLGVERPRDISAPNFLFPTMYTTTRSYVSVRGIFQEAGNTGFDSGFSQYIDGIYMGRNMSYDTDVGDVERVEILRGPQGTLFGRNVIGGAMNIITKKPTNDFHATLQAETGNWSLARIRGSVNIPIVDDKVMALVSAQRTSRKGYVRMVNAGGPNAGNIDLTTARATLLVKPTDNLKLTATFDHADSKDIPYVWEIAASQSTASPRLGDDTPFTYSGAIPPQDKKHDTGASLTAEYELSDGHVLTSITGLRTTKVHWLFNDDASPLSLILEDLNDRQKIWSEELRLTSPNGGRLEYVAGVYYYHESAAAHAYDPFPAQYPGGPFVIVYNNRVATKDYAIFGHADFHVTDALIVSGGLRYSKEKKDYFGERRVLAAGTPNVNGFIPPLLVLPPQFAGNLDEGKVNWEIGPQFHINSDAMVYGKVSTGFKGGGFNTRNGVPVKSESITSYEIGTKTTWLEKRVTANLAAFYSDYKNLQVRSLSTTPPIAVVLQNAASVHSKGAEFELQASPVDNLSFNLGVGYVDSKYTSFKNTTTILGATIDASGHRVPMTPSWTINGGVQYDLPLPGDATLVWHIDFDYIASRYSVLDAGSNLPQFLLPSYAVANARVGYKSPGDKWELMFWAKNLGDKMTPIGRIPYLITGPTAVFPSGLTLQQESYLQPRTYGVTLTAKF